MTAEDTKTFRLNWPMRVSIAMLVASVLFGAAWGIMLMFRESVAGDDLKPIASAFTVSGASLYCVLCSWLIQHQRMVVLNIAGIAAVVIAVAILNYVLWSDLRSSTIDALMMLVATLILAVTMLLLHAALGPVPLTNESFADDPSVQRLRTAARWTLTAVCMAMIFFNWFPSLRDQDSVILNGIIVLAGIAGVILAAMGPTRMRALRRRHMAQRQTLPRDAPIVMTCPRCAEQQHFTTGGARCRSCGLALFIELEEPCCACGYVLYRLPSPTCPECGRNVQAMFRPRPAADGTV